MSCNNLVLKEQTHTVLVTMVVFESVYFSNHGRFSVAYDYFSHHGRFSVAIKRGRLPYANLCISILWHKIIHMYPNPHLMARRFFIDFLMISFTMLVEFLPLVRNQL